MSFAISFRKLTVGCRLRPNPWRMVTPTPRRLYPEGESMKRRKPWAPLDRTASSPAGWGEKTTPPAGDPPAGVQSEIFPKQAATESFLNRRRAHHIPQPESSNVFIRSRREASVKRQRAYKRTRAPLPSAKLFRRIQSPWCADRLVTRQSLVRVLPYAPERVYGPRWVPHLRWEPPRL